VSRIQQLLIQLSKLHSLKFNKLESLHIKHDAHKLNQS